MELASLLELAGKTGKQSWRPMLEYVALLHKKSIHPPQGCFQHEWEEIGPGYCYGPAFGHWDIVHAVLDYVTADPAHGKLQLHNLLSLQLPDGLIPCVVWMRQGWDNTVMKMLCHPPVWHFAANDLAPDDEDGGFIESCLSSLLRQIAWFESKRKAEPFGFYFKDILTHEWESGVDEGIRFLDVKTGPLPCIDATAQVHALYERAAEWSKRLGRKSDEWEEKAGRLKSFIQEKLFSEETGFFHDAWSVDDPSRRCFSFEGMWPVVTGAASARQAMRVIDECLLNPACLFSKHPIRTVAVSDPRFEMRMWRGPAWNSMTYWAARGCRRYGRDDAAGRLLEMALDASAEQFERTGTIWEFYHSEGGRPEDVSRKPASEFNMPCRDYLGHNPLIAMAELYDSTRG